MIVAKVGGSLYDWPSLPCALHAWLADIAADRVLLVPGGGATADAIRAFDRTFQLGEENAHWLAIRTLSVNARLLMVLLPNSTLLSHPTETASWHGCRVLDPLPFFQADEASAAHLPHRWDVTSDSLALRTAIILGARELVLLKSTDAEFENWQQASVTDVVDRYFTSALQAAPASLRVHIVNLRRWHAVHQAESNPRGL